jgi:hypothetical protein
MKLVSVTLLMLLSGLAANAESITFDFEDVPLGRVTSFTETKGGIVATFTTTDPSGLDVYQNSGSFFPPPFMGHAVENGTGFPIIVTFSMPLESASVDFAMDNLQGISTLFTMKAYSGGTGGTLLATSGTLGTPPAPLGFPQGTGTISALGFDTLVFSGPQPGLAIDNLTVSTAVSAVPEPGTLSMLLIGLLAVTCWNKRKFFRLYRYDQQTASIDCAPKIRIK